MTDDHEDWFGPDPEDIGCERPHGVRFGEGQNRNAGGRPPGSPNRNTITKRVANKRHKVKLNGRQRSVTTLELVMLKIRNRAARGDIAAYKLKERLAARFAPVEAGLTARFIRVEKMTGDEWDAVYGFPTCSEEIHQQYILEQFPYMLSHRKRWLAYQEETSGYSSGESN